MIKAARVINPCHLKPGDIILSRHDTLRSGESYTFRVRVTPSLGADVISIYPDNRYQSDSYSFMQHTIFYKLSEGIGWFWNVSHSMILVAMGGNLNLGI